MRAVCTEGRQGDLAAVLFGNNPAWVVFAPWHAYFRDWRADLPRGRSCTEGLFSYASL
jgi:hypothetical protein